MDTAVIHPRRLRPERVLLSWGLGADSSAIIAEMVRDPEAYGLKVDLSNLVVVVALVGDEWPDTMDLAEEHILPLLRRHRVRLVQVARGGPRDGDGVLVLSDTRYPKYLFRRGPWALSDEMRQNGTVPQFASGRRICSIKFKGWVIDTWVAAVFGDEPYRHIIGYEANEERRAKRDQTYASTTRIPWYPLIEWGWDRPRILDFLQARFGIEWPKSYCTFCPFPGVAASLPVHLERCRTFPEMAAVSLLLEHQAMALNPRSTLYRDQSLRSVIGRDGNTAALEAFDGLLEHGVWAVYEIRRVYFAARTATCRTEHPKSCRGTQPDCRDRHRKGTTWRAVRTLAEGTRDDAHAYLKREGALMREPVIAVNDLARVAFRDRGETFPATEGFLVLAPAGVTDKKRATFDDAWLEATGTPLAICGA